MKFFKKHYLVIIAIFISLVVGRQLLTNAHFHTHDDLQVFRLNEYLSCLKDGQIPCRWSAELGKGYGYPYFIFYPPMIYFIPAIIHLIFQTSLITSLNLFAYLTFPLSTLGMYLLIKQLTQDKFSAFTAALLYIFVPYHALNIFVRGVYAENLAWTILPYLFLFTYRLVKSTSSFLPLTLVTSILLLTHNISSMLMLPLIFLWVLGFGLISKNYRALGRYFLSQLLALGLSAFFFIPAIFEKSLVQTDSMIYGYYSYLNHFVSLKQIFLSHYWGFGGSNFGTQYDEMSFAIGYALTLGTLGLSLWTLFKTELTRTQRFFSLFFSLFGGLSLFMMHNQSTFIWRAIPILAYIQFPWRLLGVASTLLIIGIGYNLSLIIHKKLRFIFSLALILIAIFSSYPYFQPKSFDTYQDQDFLTGQFKLEQQTAHLYDYLPVTARSVPDEFATQAIFKPPKTIKVVSSKRTSRSFNLTYQLQTAQTLILAQYFYPGWQAKLDGQVINIYPDKQYGFISFHSPVGQHKLELSFARTPLRIWSDYLSLFSAILVLILFLRYNKAHAK